MKTQVSMIMCDYCDNSLSIRNVQAYINLLMYNESNTKNIVHMTGISSSVKVVLSKSHMHVRLVYLAKTAK